VIERGQFGAVVGPPGVVQAKPQLREFAGSIHHDAGAGIAGVGFTGTIAINADIELLRVSRIPSRIPCQALVICLSYLIHASSAELKSISTEVSTLHGPGSEGGIVGDEAIERADTKRH